MSHPASNKNRFINLRVRHEDYIDIKRFAQRSGVSVSDLLRDVLAEKNIICL